jgi:glycosyltransferase involved in cell wall biosynthesis
MRVVIDLQGAQSESRFRGIGRYASAFAQALARNRGDHQIVLALSDLFPETVEPIRAAFDGLLPQQDIRIWSAPGPVREITAGNDARRGVAELIREAFLLSLEPDVVHVSSLFEGYADDAVTSIGRLDADTLVSATLFDLIPLANPRPYLERDPAYERFYRRKLEHLRRASLLLAISRSAADEARAHLDGLQGEVVPVSTAASAEFRAVQRSAGEIRELRRQLGIRGDFLLYTGGADERKNLPRLIAAYAGLPEALRARVQLVIAGAMPDAAVAALGAQAGAAHLRSDELVFTGYVSDDTLVALYNLCTAFVFPSWHEGFGLPALEAMQCGAAVIGANTSSLPEVVGCSDALFDPFDVPAIRSKIAQVVEDSCFRDRLAAHGLRRAREFSWDKVAHAALTAFEGLRRGEARGAAGVAAERVTRMVVDAVADACPPQVAEAEVAAIAQSIARIGAAGAKPRLFVDCSELAQRDAGTGIQRVTRSILAELLADPPDAFTLLPVYATVDVPGYRHAARFCAEPGATGAASEGDMPVDFAPGDVFLGLDLQHHVVIAQRDYLDMQRRHGVLVIFVVYDLLPISLPAAFPAGADDGHRAWLEVVGRYDGALCISRAVAGELDAWLRSYPLPRLRPFQVRSFPLGADLHGTVADAELPPEAIRTLAELAGGTSFLVVGTLEPRKGHEQVLRAFELLWARGEQVNLVIVGREGWMVAALCERLRRHPERGGRLHWLDDVGDAYLDRLYRACACLISASLGEGFGLPLIEAAQHGMPIIARDIPVFREVAGEHALYFHGTQPRDLAAAISTWRELEATGRHPRPAGMTWPTWKQSAAALTEIVVEMREGSCRPSEPN